MSLSDELDEGLTDHFRGSDHDPNNDCGHAKKLHDLDGKSGHGTHPILTLHHGGSALP
jgi:hypothetical protein